MEFGYGKRDGSYCEEKEEEGEEGQEDSTNKHSMLSMTSTCSSSSSHLHPLPPTPPSLPGAPSSNNAGAAATEKEHMFDKVATPSDVGKLNRLVIPKQHAERYLPLDHSANEKGLLLNFEDPTGKPWLFRYSYWNSSQSYVMTKGWSRFVKEKMLDAGDTVSFSRGVGEPVKVRYFIDWKRKPEIHHDPSSRLLLLHPRVSTYPFMPSGSNYPMVSFSRSAGPWAGRLLFPTPPPDAGDAHDPRQRYSYRYNNVVTSAATSSSGSGQYFGSAAAATPPPDIAVQSASADATLGVPVVQQKAAAKRVTLFGVNLDIQESDRQHPYQRPAPLQLQQQQQQQQAFSSSSTSPSPTEQSLDLGL